MNRYKITCISLAALVLSAAALLGGCGNAVSPLSPGESAALRNGTDTGNSGITAAFVFSTRGLDASRVIRSAKPTGKAISKKVSKVISKRSGGDLTAFLPKPPDIPRDATYVTGVKFEVARGSMDADTEISMEVFSGATLEDVVIVFGPSGAKFNPPATLTLYVAGPLSRRNLTAQHIEGDGDTSSAQILDLDYLYNYGVWQITLKVPGFSRYSLGDD